MALKKLGAAAVISDREGRVLLVRHAYGRLNWELPGGHAEAAESAVETALREVREETGLVVIAERLSGVYYERDADFHHFVFVCRQVGDLAPRIDGDEITARAYYAPDALPRPISDFTVRRIQDALSGVTHHLPVDVPPRRWLE